MKVPLNTPSVGARITVGVVLVDERGRVLMQLRDDRPDITDPGCWTVPGGGLESGETLDETARREFLEETGYKVGDLFAVHSDVTYRPDGSREDRHFFVGRYDGLQTVSCFEGQEIRFVASRERASLTTSSHLHEIIQKALVELELRESLEPVKTQNPDSRKDCS